MRAAAGPAVPTPGIGRVPVRSLPARLDRPALRRPARDGLRSNLEVDVRGVNRPAPRRTRRPLRGQGGPYSGSFRSGTIEPLPAGEGRTTRHDTGVTRLTGTRHPAFGVTGFPYFFDRIVAVAATAARTRRLGASQTQPLPSSHLPAGGAA